LSNALQLGKPVALKDSNLSLVYSKKDSFHITWFKKNQRIIEQQFNKNFNTPIKFSIQEIEVEQDISKPEPKAVDRDTLGKSIKEDPLLNKLVDELGLEIT